MAFAVGIVNNLFQSAARPSDSICAPALDGKATFNWLLQMDTVAKTITTGGAKPVMSPAQGYAFDVEMIVQGGTMFDIKPATMGVTLTPQPDGSTAFSASQGVDLVMPVYLDAQAMTVVLLPLRSLRFSNGLLSKDHNCIGAFNSNGLDPASNCLHDGQNPAFLTGVDFDGFITIADADKVVVDPLAESLCALLSGSSNGAQPVAKCKVGTLGDYCSTTHAPGGCADSFQLSGKLAASGVTIN
jgi:hypothetical protein